MPGIRGPADYSLEPPRHPSLKINAKEPFNAEPPRAALISSYVTPVDMFYKRNHGPIPVVDDIERYHVSIGGLVEKPIRLSLAEIRKLPKYNVAATLQCAGNRRTAMSKTRKVRGVGWDVAALGNAKPRTFVRAVFIQMLAEDEWAFDLLYCVAFMVMDKQWLERNASYMDFSEVLSSTRARLERELLLDDVMRIKDMPSYSPLS